MVKEKKPDQTCPECKFDGTDGPTYADGSQQFPKGFGIENLMLTEIIEGTQQSKIVHYQRRRCPVCGFESAKEKVKKEADKN